MQVGSVAAWIAVTSKIIAIVGAITFPIIGERKRKKALISHLAHREYALVKEIENELKDSLDDVVDLDSYKEFKSFNLMLMIISDDEELIQISEEINNLLLKQTDTGYFDQPLRKLLKRLESKFSD
ncbi:hypothetical protein FQS96_02065 [Enterococcus faecalis]|uniref:hypothetical protein n=1 Tax=Enterococcus TaxID=1350 RepID=UPI001A97A894|nr:hypothetical protein [Enterococcus faecalis]MBO1124256.1 hypothetical protein [Enterococcus faecalis]